MKKVLILFLCIISLNVYANEKEKVKFVKCVDGDTATFKIDNKDVKVRFLAIDTPETVHPTKSVEAYGKNASEYTCNKITNAKSIVLEYDAKSTKEDKYGRLLAWVWVDDSLLQKELIAVGYAQIKYVYGKYSYLDELEDVQNKAKEEKLGIWSDYEEKTYTVTFDDNGKKTTVKVLEEETVESMENTADDFEGWYLNDQKYDFNTKITNDITLKAKYKESISTSDLIYVILIVIVIYIINPKKAKKIIKKCFK